MWIGCDQPPEALVMFQISAVFFWQRALTTLRLNSSPLTDPGAVAAVESPVPLLLDLAHVDVGQPPEFGRLGQHAAVVRHLGAKAELEDLVADAGRQDLAGRAGAVLVLQHVDQIDVGEPEKSTTMSIRSATDMLTLVALDRKGSRLPSLETCQNFMSLLNLNCRSGTARC